MAKKKLSDSAKIDAIIDLLRANGMSLPPALGGVAPKPAAPPEPEAEPEPEE